MVQIGMKGLRRVRTAEHFAHCFGASGSRPAVKGTDGGAWKQIGLGRRSRKNINWNLGGENIAPAACCCDQSERALVGWVVRFSDDRAEDENENERDVRLSRRSGDEGEEGQMASLRRFVLWLPAREGHVAINPVNLEAGVPLASCPLPPLSHPKHKPSRVGRLLVSPRTAPSPVLLFFLIFSLRPHEPPPHPTAHGPSSLL